MIASRERLVRLAFSLAFPKPRMEVSHSTLIFMCNPWVDSAYSVPLAILEPVLLFIALLYHKMHPTPHAADFPWLPYDEQSCRGNFPKSATH